ncbi:MAG: hypothetical protein ABIG45_09570 [Bacillota bacterium]
MQKIRRGAGRKNAQSLPVFYLGALLYVFIASIVYFITFAPLSALFLFESGSPLKYLALLCPALLIFVTLPLRFSFAQAVAGRYHRAPFTLKAAFNPSLYGEKVAEGLLYALHLIKWAIPLAAAGWALYYLYNNSEAFTMIKGVTDLGTTMTAIWNSVANFFVSIFGGTQAAVSGGIVEGVFSILGTLGVCALILIWGIVRNSAYRYIWAEATEYDKNPRFEARRSLRGRRFQQLGISLINLALLLPALAMLYILADPKESVEILSTQYADALISQTALPAIAVPYGKLAILFFACYLPLVPLRRMITARFATARIHRQMQTPQPAIDVNSASPLLYEDKPAAPDGRKP